MTEHEDDNGGKIQIGRSYKEKCILTSTIQNTCSVKREIKLKKKRINKLRQIAGSTGIWRNVKMVW
jgi:hypothetical protein